jgi:hypothetical protein
MGSNLSWVFNNIPQDGYKYRGFTAAEILQIHEVDFNVFFPEKKIQEERDKKLNELLK